MKAPAAHGPQWSPWLEFGGSWSSERSRAEATLWSPLWQSQTSLLFTDLRGKLFEESVSEGNFALGFRHMLPSGWNLGLWGAYDVRRSTTGNVFHQAALGIEALHENWDLRLNGYIPLSDPKSSPGLAAAQIAGPQIMMTGGREVPLHGVDAEAGFRLPSPLPNHELRLYAGGFWFDAKDALREVAGPKARLEWRIEDVLPSLSGSRLTLEAGVRHDQVRRTDWEVGARLRIPFGGGGSRLASLSPQAGRMTERIERDTDIVSAPSGAEPVADAITGVNLDRVVYTADNNDSVFDASVAAGPNALIVVNGTLSGQQMTQGHGGQTVQGGGSTVMLRGSRSGTVFGFTAPGAAALLDTPGGNPNLIVTGPDTHIAGLTVQGDGGGGNTGILVSTGLDNVAITQASIAGTGLHGIEFGSNHRDIVISGVTVTGPVTHGILFVSNNENVSVSNTSIAGAGLDGIHFDDENVGVRLSGVTLDGAGGFGIFFNRDNTITLDNSRLSGAFGQDGILLGSSGNVLNGGSNTAAGATFTGNLCQDGLNAWTGSVVFDGVPITAMNCP